MTPQPKQISRRTLLQTAIAAGLTTPAFLQAHVSVSEFNNMINQQTDPNNQDTPKPAPRIARFERMAYGLFVHWGLYSQLGKGEWAMNMHRIPHDEYFELMKTFTAADFDGRALAKLARAAGMKYITHTSRHHDGFSLYDTQGLSKRDVTHTPAGRDLIADFVTGCRAEDIEPMLYCTTLDWTDPRFNNDFKAYLQYLRDSVEILCTNYGPIGGFWFDGNWSKRNADWEVDALYAVIRKHQPEALIINNTGIEHGGAVGNPEIDSVTFERGRPEPFDRTGWPKYVTGEMCHTLNFHWGQALNDFNYLSPAHVIEELCHCRRAGANFLLNVGPSATGAVPEYEAALLRKVGDWIKLHGGDDGPIYHGLPTNTIKGTQNDFALEQGNDLYLFIFNLTETSNTMALGSQARGPGPRNFTGIENPQKYTTAKWMDNHQTLKLESNQNEDQLTLHATGYPYGTNTVVRIAHLTT